MFHHRRRLSSTLLLSSLRSNVSAVQQQVLGSSSRRQSSGGSKKSTPLKNGGRSYTTVAVKNFDHGTPEAAFYALFRPFGEVFKIRLESPPSRATDSQSTTGGGAPLTDPGTDDDGDVGYLQFKCLEEAKNAVQSLNGSFGLQRTQRQRGSLGKTIAPLEVTLLEEHQEEEEEERTPTTTKDCGKSEFQQHETPDREAPRTDTVHGALSSSPSAALVIRPLIRRTMEDGGAQVREFFEKYGEITKIEVGVVENNLEEDPEKSSSSSCSTTSPAETCWAKISFLDSASVERARKSMQGSMIFRDAQRQEIMDLVGSEPDSKFLLRPLSVSIED